MCASALAPLVNKANEDTSVASDTYRRNILPQCIRSSAQSPVAAGNCNQTSFLQHIIYQFIMLITYRHSSVPIQTAEYYC